MGMIDPGEEADRQLQASGTLVERALAALRAYGGDDLTRDTVAQILHGWRHAGQLDAHQVKLICQHFPEPERSRQDDWAGNSGPGYIPRWTP